MAKPHRFTTKQVIDALRDKGMVSIAAQRLRCAPDTVQNYCKKFPTVAQAKENARTEMLDEAELRLWQAIQRDEAGPSPLPCAPLAGAEAMASTSP